MRSGSGPSKESNEVASSFVGCTGTEAGAGVDAAEAAAGGGVAAAVEACREPINAIPPDGHMFRLEDKDGLKDEIREYDRLVKLAIPCSVLS